MLNYFILLLSLSLAIVKSSKTDNKNVCKANSSSTESEVTDKIKELEEESFLSTFKLEGKQYKLENCIRSQNKLIDKFEQEDEEEKRKKYSKALEYYINKIAKYRKSIESTKYMIEYLKRDIQLCNIKLKQIVRKLDINSPSPNKVRKLKFR